MPRNGVRRFLMIELREYRPDDLDEILRLFHDTVHCVAAADYTPAQLDAWSPTEPDRESWQKSLESHTAIVAIADGAIVGFGDADIDTGYLDRLYVHKDFLRHGIATAICDRLECQFVSQYIFTHSSITARPFFERRGYSVAEQRRVIRMGTELTNFRMTKSLLK